MRTNVKKWGNSAAIRLPASVMEAAHLHVDEAVDVRVEDGRIVIDPARPATYDLAALLAGVTPENLHEATEWGSPVGSEIEV
jgi:antitoxin MazE